MPGLRQRSSCPESPLCPEARSRMPKSHRDLVVWEKAVALAGAILRLTRTFPNHERWELTSQINRAAVSVAANIAEGAGIRNRSLAAAGFAHRARLPCGAGNGNLGRNINGIRWDEQRLSAAHHRNRAPAEFAHGSNPAGREVPCSLSRIVGRLSSGFLPFPASSPSPASPARCSPRARSRSTSAQTWPQTQDHRDSGRQR